ncbi:RNA polymerase sigma factor [Actinomadura craniellae]|uniref:RNA polymerase sigma factor n=1 Tax=Actinomadura craniellae TaxID=2231787 RepID=A0A365H6E9_9ACTN|nr:sigma-70 family RNA polymerase sigma factor [Actinomadura craniellae]RAY14566.1 RNA polymerase sigma factor [Actinomadura craniellae]
MPRWSPLDPEIDRRFVQDLNEGGEEALAALYDRYAERLYDYCLTLTWESKAAADLVHDTFIDAYRRAPRMRDRTQLRAWLYGAARRRCLQRGRARGLYWDWMDQPGVVIDSETGLTVPGLSELFESALSRLDFADQEVLLLALRHGLSGLGLAAVLGVPARRAATRLAQARARGEAVVAEEAQALSRQCADRAIVRAREPAEAGAEMDAFEADEHGENCLDCRRRARVAIGPLYALAPAPVLPVALRHRVLHTATDPELAGHRADIAARGGGLTPDGMPHQPDVPSHTARRWLFAGGGAAGALVTALVAVLVMGPGITVAPNLEWPFQPQPRPTASPAAPDTEEPVALPPGGAPPAGGRPGDAGPPGPRNEEPTPAPGRGPQTPVPPRPGQLVVGPDVLTLRPGQSVGHLTLTAVQGPVLWNATSSSVLVSLSESTGTVPLGSEVKVDVKLARGLLRLPGEATVTFAAETGAEQQIKVTWGLSLL